MICKKCGEIMINGIALDTTELPYHSCFSFGINYMNAETLKIIDCLKCPACGHSEAIDGKSI